MIALIESHTHGAACLLGFIALVALAWDFVANGPAGKDGDE